MKTIFVMNTDFVVLFYHLDWEIAQSRSSQLHQLAPVIRRQSVTAIVPAILNVHPVLRVADARQTQPDYGGFLVYSLFFDAVIEQF